MRTQRLSTKILLAGILSAAVVGCDGTSSDGEDTGGATGGAEATGGAVTGGVASGGAATGGAATGGGSGQTGGTTGAGGSTVAPPTGGTTGSGGAAATGGSPPMGGQTTGGMGVGGMGDPGGSGGAVPSGGAAGTGNAGGAVASGGAAGAGGPGGGFGGAETGGSADTGGVPNGGAATGGSATGGNPGVGGGTCTASQDAGRAVSGSGPHDVVVETNSDAGINEGTIYRPADLGGEEKYPIFVWGNGACTRQGFSNATAMGELASHGYFVVADGTPSGGGESIAMSSDVVGMAKPLLAYITWAIAENEKPCSAYYQSLDTTKIAANGFSCGGLMAEGTAGDPRMTTWGITSSGLTGASPSFYDTVHTPVLVILGGPSDIAYENGERDYDNISALGLPIMLFSKDIGHGGDLGSPNGGDFTKINLAWLNWWLKGDEGATGKGVLVGSGCTYCTNSAWEVKSANLP